MAPLNNATVVPKPKLHWTQFLLDDPRQELYYQDIYDKRFGTRKVPILTGIQYGGREFAGAPYRFAEEPTVASSLFSSSWDPEIGRRLQMVGPVLDTYDHCLEETEAELWERIGRRLKEDLDREKREDDLRGKREQADIRAVRDNPHHIPLAPPIPMAGPSMTLHNSTLPAVRAEIRAHPGLYMKGVGWFPSPASGTYRDQNGILRDNEEELRILRAPSRVRPTGSVPQRNAAVLLNVAPGSPLPSRQSLSSGETLSPLERRSTS